MQIKLIFSIIFLFTIVASNLSAKNNIVIEFIIEDEIITNQDIVNEQNYLLALNNSLKEISKSQIKVLAKNSLIKEKIKKKELSKYFDFEKPDQYLEKVFKDLYKRLNFKSENEFKKYLLNFNLNVEVVKGKLKVETLWNQFIYDKFKNSLSVDKGSLKKKIQQKANNQNNKIEEFFLSEILFQVTSEETVAEKYNLISDSIKRLGFKNTAIIYGISDTAKYGGEIGWVNKTQLSKVISKEIDLIKEQEFTKPIQTSNGFLILKVNQKRETERKINLKDELNRLVIIEQNKQLNQFSTIYFNKIKQNIFISES